MHSFLSGQWIFFVVLCCCLNLCFQLLVCHLLAHFFLLNQTSNCGDTRPVLAKYQRMSWDGQFKPPICISCQLKVFCLFGSSWGNTYAGNQIASKQLMWILKPQNGHCSIYVTFSNIDHHLRTFLAHNTVNLDSK